MPNSQPNKVDASICLNMIVKDESHVIEKTLRNIAQHIPITSFLICDTGSTDDTIAIIKRVMGDLGIEGTVLEHEWKNFEHNRNLALKAAKGKADYAFIFDADDFIHGEPGSLHLPTKLTADGYNLKFYSPGCSYVRPLLVRLDRPWEYEGVVHECLSSANGYNPILVDIQGSYNIESGRTGSRNKDKDKYKKDALLLEEAIADPKTKPNLIPRYAFYCGQSWIDHGEREKGIYWYKKVVNEYNNWTEEKYYSCYRLGNVLRDMGRKEEAIYYYLRSPEYNKERFECATEAAKIYIADRHFDAAKNILLPYQDAAFNRNDVYPNTLFSPQAIYRYDFLIQVALYSFYTQDYNLMSKTVQTLYNRCANQYDPTLAHTLLENSHFYFQHYKVTNGMTEVRELFGNVKSVLRQHIEKVSLQVVDKQRTKFDVHFTNIVKQLYRNVPITTEFPSLEPDNKPIITVATITTCKRIDYFIQTMESLLDSLDGDDIRRIDKWYVVDDNSSQEDRALMKRLYPFVTVIEKTPEQKGHRPSMNIIYDLLTKAHPDALYWLHLEDDWMFVDKRCYISQAISYLTHPILKNLNVKQVLFNKGYGETIGDILPPVGNQVIPNDKHFLLHVQNQQVPIASSSYWAHYSFRPSLTLVSAIKELGNFDSPNSFFEGDYAKRFCERGFRSGYFSDITSLHIGKLSGTRGSSSSEQNAYQRNNVSQFTKTNDVPQTSASQPVCLEINDKRSANAQFTVSSQITDMSFQEVTTDTLVFDNTRLKKSTNDWSYKDEADDIVRNVVSQIQPSFYTGTAVNGPSFTQTNVLSLPVEEQLKQSPFAGLTPPPPVNLMDILPANTLFEEKFDEFVFVEGLDIIGHDAEYIQDRDLEIYIKHARNVPYCVAFNTLGFTKYRVGKLERSPYFGKGDGIYIKKSALTAY